MALANGLNANMLRRWVVEAERVGAMAVSGRGALAVGATAVANTVRPPLFPCRGRRRRRLRRKVRTIMLGSGTEFHDYDKVERAYAVEFYFATPYHSWE